MTWQIPVAFQSRDQTITEAIECGVDRIFKGDEHRIFFELLFDHPVRVKTMGELEDHIEGLDPDRGKALLDKYRKAAGLPTIGEVEGAQALRRARADDPPRPAPQPHRDQNGRAPQTCHAPGCETPSVDAEGVIGPVPERRWHCPEHRVEAAPRDLEPWEPNTVQVDPRSGALILDPEAEAQDAEFYRRQAEQRTEERRRRREKREAAAEEIEAFRRVQRERLEREIPPGVPLP